MLDTTSPIVVPPVELAPIWASAQLSLDAAQRLWLTLAGKTVQVKPVRCFPWSSPHELVSLRDEQDDEQLNVTDPS